jgi:heme-degrading monooxygenase HmoA
VAPLFVQHKLADYAHWGKVFDRTDSFEKTFGWIGAQVYRSAGDPNEVVVIEDWPTLDAVQRFAQSSELDNAMERAGVVPQPQMLFLEEA